jgi:hypothetical protein
LTPIIEEDDTDTDTAQRERQARQFRKVKSGELTEPKGIKRSKPKEVSGSKEE